MFASNALIPIRDDNPTRSRSFVTVGIIGLNVLFFLAEPNLGTGTSCTLASFLFKWGLVPREITTGHALTGALSSFVSPAGACPGVLLEPKSIYFSILSSMFLHGGLLHLGGNMLFLWIFGNNIEDTLGKPRFVVFYLVVGVAAALAHAFVNRGSLAPTIGASGAISGILGAYIILFPRAQITTAVPIFFFLKFMRLPAVAFLGIWFVYQFLIGQGQTITGGSVAWVAHVGGFIAGMFLIVAFGGLSRRPRPTLG